MFAATIASSALLAVALIPWARGKLVGDPRQSDGMRAVKFPTDKMWLLGIAEFGGAAGLAAALFWWPLGVAAAVCLIAYFGGALAYLLRADIDLDALAVDARRSCRGSRRLAAHTSVTRSPAAMLRYDPPRVQVQSGSHASRELGIACAISSPGRHFDSGRNRRFACSNSLPYEVLAARIWPLRLDGSGPRWAARQPLSTWIQP